VAIWKLFANPDWFVIGKSRDTTQAHIVGRLDDSWLKINGTVAATKMQATTGAYTNLTAGTATVTTLVSTTGTITNLGSTAATITTGTITNLGSAAATITTLGSTLATLATASTTTLTTTYFSASDTTGLYLYNASGTRYRIFVTASGAVSIAAAP
jgi:hypothetical protein